MFEGTEENGWSRARGSGERRLVNEFDTTDFIHPGDLGGGRFFVDREPKMTGEIVVNDGVGQG